MREELLGPHLRYGTNFRRAHSVSEGPPAHLANSVGFGATTQTGRSWAEAGSWAETSLGWGSSECGDGSPRSWWATSSIAAQASGGTSARWSPRRPTSQRQTALSGPGEQRPGAGPNRGIRASLVVPGRAASQAPPSRRTGGGGPPPPPHRVGRPSGDDAQMCQTPRGPLFGGEEEEEKAVVATGKTRPPTLRRPECGPTVPEADDLALGSFSNAAAGLRAAVQTADAWAAEAQNRPAHDFPNTRSAAACGPPPLIMEF